MKVHYFICIASTLRALRSKVRTPIGIRDFYVFQNFQTGSGAHPPSYLMKTGGFPRAKKLPRRAFNFSPPFRAMVRNEWSYISTPPICIYGADRENLTFLPFLQEYYVISLTFSMLVLMKFWVNTCKFCAILI